MPTTAKRNATVEEILAAVETAKERVMAEEVKSYTKLGIPKAMAYQMVASRFRQKSSDDDPDPFEATTQEGWEG